MLILILHFKNFEHKILEWLQSFEFVLFSFTVIALLLFEISVTYSGYFGDQFTGLGAQTLTNFQVVFFQLYLNKN